MTSTFLAAALSCAAGAKAATTAILRPRGDAPQVKETLFRLQGELLSVGLEVELVDRPPRFDAAEGDQRSSLERMAVERGLDAIIDVVSDSSQLSVDIWVFKPAPRRSEVSRVVAEPNRANAAETLAIRAIDVVRSRLLEIDLAKRGKSVPRSAGRAPEVSAASPARPASVERIGIAAGAAVLTSLDGVGPAIVPMLRLDWALQSRLALQATFAALGSRPSVARSAGRARVSQAYGLLGVCYCSPSEPGLTLFASLAAGALRTSVEGEANAPATGHDLAQWSFLVDGSVGARLRFPGPFYMTLASHAHLATPYVSIHFVDAEVASSGRPNLLFALTVGAWL